MLTVANLRDINPEDYDEVWIIMRHLKSVPEIIKHKPNVKHVPELSPSEELFSWYRKIKKEGRWIKPVFDNQYVPKFLLEMKNKESMNALNTLYKKSKSLNICIGCTCTIEYMCHRSIIAGLLCGTNVTVQDDLKRPLEKYKFYYDMYKNTGEQK